MTLKQLIFFITAIMLLHGCASQETYNASLNSWIGSHKSELLRSWGKPAKTYSQDGSTYLVYDKSGPGSGDMGYKQHVIDLGDCTTTFEIADDTVISSTFKGVDCRAIAVP